MASPRREAYMPAKPLVHSTAALVERYVRRMDLGELQVIIERTFGDRDRLRGVPASVAWLAEEVGELAQAVRKGSPDQQLHEFADVLAWVATLANQMGVDLNEAIQRYATGCPRCGASPCTCPF
jgi:NTP pyrophosphatase (non-canonical NTP hydrolase)